MSRNSAISLPSEGFARIGLIGGPAGAVSAPVYDLFLEKLVLRDGEGHFARLRADEIGQSEDHAIDHPNDYGEDGQKAEKAWHRGGLWCGGLDIRPYVRGPAWQMSNRKPCETTESWTVPIDLAFAKMPPASGANVRAGKSSSSSAIEIIQHVRPSLARVSGNRLREGSIGDAIAAGPRRPGRLMTDSIASAASYPSREAEIVAALGKRQIVLVGMMGAGKSTVGRRLATRLRVPFADADTEIEAAASMSIPEIFEAHGEPYFRDGEVRVIARLLEGGPAVLATGGGALTREETRRRIQEKGISVWLKADADVILRRVKRRADRPLLQTLDPAATVDRLIAEREPIYQHADLTIWSRDVPHEKIVEECLDALHARLCGGDRAGVAGAA